MEPHPRRPSDSKQRLEQPDPSDRFYLEKLIGYYNARGMFLERDGRVFFRDTYQRHKRHLRKGKLEDRAYVANLAFLWGDGSAVDAFLRGLFQSWPSFPEERRSALREALFAELAGQYRRPARDFESNPPPWLNRNIPNPKGYLATKVFKQAEGILGKRRQVDKLTRRIGELRDDALVDAECTKNEAWDQAVKQVVAELTGSAIDYTPEPDPGEVISTRYDKRNQAIEQVAVEGREVRIPQRPRRSVLLLLGAQT
jgi:hypothetical protein